MTDQIRDQLQASLGTAYTLERELGGGGMSRVFLAEEVRLHRRVVIKLLSPELAQGVSAERFEREITLAAQLQHPHIVPLLNAGATAEGLPYYTMPFVKGESLRQKLSQSPPLTMAEATDVLRDVAKALSYAHRQGVVHRDIKPENVLLTEGAAAVSDFGIAKALSASKTSAPGGTMTAVGTSLGTPAYMAPEQAAGDSVDAPADVYAWGVMAYELIAGAHPFASKTTAQQLIAAHISELPTALAVKQPTVPAALAELVMRCLEKDPARRPATGAELLTAIEGARTGPTAIVAAPRGSRSRIIIAALAVGALALGAGAFAWTRGRPASTDAQVVAIVPFRVAGADASLHYLREGMLDLLATKLSRIPSPRCVMRWRVCGGSISVL